jgi:hypothetical protein
MADDACVICKRTEDDHGDVRHTYTPPGTRVDVSQFAPKRPEDDVAQVIQGAGEPSAYSVVQTPFDPVLRLALINKGIITPEDLDQAAKMIQVTTQQVLGGDSGG